MASEGPFRAVGSKERLVDRVVAELERLIISGELELGAKLPPERELAEQIGVSRTVLREAVRILVTKGLLATKHGVGTVVQQASRDQLVENLSLLMKVHGLTLDHLHQVRSLLEVENASLAAQQATAPDLEELQRVLEELEQTTDPRLVAVKDAAFHAALARTTHNPLLIMLHDSIADLMSEIRVSLSKYPDLAVGGMPDHRRIFESVVARDVEAARQAMRDHLQRARRIQAEYLARESKGREHVLSTDQPLHTLGEAHR